MRRRDVPEGDRRLHRASEHAHGRAAAREALFLLGGPCLAVAPLPRDADGCPVWPSAVVGSIAHSAPWAAAAVAWKRHGVLGVGIDAEAVHPRRAVLAERVVMPEDAAAADPKSSPALVATVFFALREAAYKCVFPSLRAPMDWSDVRFETDWHRGTCAVVIAPMRGASLFARFCCDGNTVRALCWQIQEQHA
ncbi:4'-phosphopantetheinyl transferase superfamily protein [Sinomonas terricola]|uniref:4'-phosphopantetheinyl transferase superfamily protein n=1 Tax=Sinomonas terricola TaxID=3110330 RepID=UPI003D176CD2